MLKRILMATDGSARAQKAATQAIELAKSCGTELNVISVVDSGSPRSAIDIDPYDIVDEDTAILDKLDEEKKKPEMAFVKRIVEMAADEGLSAGSEVRIGNPAEEILAYAKESSSDVIVIGSHGRGAIASAVMGSVASSIVHKGDLPVLLVPVHED